MASHIRKITQGASLSVSMATVASIDFCGSGESHRPDTTIGMLPDNALLDIFDLCREDFRSTTVWEWHLLAHVCRRWRQIVFESPHRLNLQIHCTNRTPVREHLGIWPAFPIFVDYRYSGWGIPPSDEEDNVIAALEHPDRVCYVKLSVKGSQLAKMVTIMQEPFPVLTHLDISGGKCASVLPAEFLGRSAPCLQDIRLYGIAFPALPTLLLSSNDLVELHLRNIPPTGYISPEAMVASLAALHRLEVFVIQFQSASPCLNRIHPPPVTRNVLPALTCFVFQGASKYLEDFVAQIDSPRLDQIVIYYLTELVDFQVTQLSKFVDRSVGPKLTPFGYARILFVWGRATLFINHEENHASSDPRPAETLVSCSCEAIDWNFWNLAQVFNLFSTTLVHLNLYAKHDEDFEFENMDIDEWVHLLHQFSAVQTLRVSQGLAGHVALALEDITGEMVTEVLQCLDLIYLVGQSASSIEKFVAARRLSGRPVVVIETETEFDQRLDSHDNK